MKSRSLLVLILLLVFGAFGTMTFAAEATPSASVPSYLQDISVTVKAERAQGSGTLVTRKVGDDTVTFVWTAGHVVDGLRSIRKVVDAEGGQKILVEFRDPQIVQERHQDGRRVGEQTLDCRVIKYSDADYGEDLAVLMIRLKNSYPLDISAKFHSNVNYIPPIGVDLSHCGSLLGQFGANSYTTGVLSQTGRLLEGSGANKQVFDQVTAVAFPGSSGGGMYLKEDGVYIGMLTQGVTALQGFNFIVPVRRMHAWAEKSGIVWALDPSVPMPSLAEIDKIKVEDLGSIPAGFRDMGGGEYRKPVNKNGIGRWILPATQPTVKSPFESPFESLFKIERLIQIGQ